MATGQVVGAAAALMLKKSADARDISYSELVSYLHSIGAIVPPVGDDAR